MAIEEASIEHPALDKIAAEAQLVVRTIEKMKVLLRNVQTKHRNVNLSTVVKSSILQVEQSLAKHQIFVSEQGTDKACRILGDEGQLQLAITNLLRNAFTYTERGLVSVSLENKSLVVSDTGIGINPAQLPHIFGRFNRGSSHGDGFGLGLAIVQRVCDLHGWIIDVDSTPAKGTTFRLTLP
jgi:signal transduction histidine kinase